MSEYKITAIDDNPPREWDGPNGKVYYISVGLEGHDKPVSIGKKSPDALKVGDTVHGTIIPTDYLTDKWKGEAPQGISSSTQGPVTVSTPKTLDYEPSTNTRWAIGMAYKAFVQVTGTPESASGEFPFDAVKTHAGELLRLYDELKRGSLGVAHPAPAIKEAEKPATIQDKLAKGFSEKDEPHFEEEHA